MKGLSISCVNTSIKLIALNVKFILSECLNAIEIRRVSPELLVQDDFILDLGKLRS